MYCLNLAYELEELREIEDMEKQLNLKPKQPKNSKLLPFERKTKVTLDR